MKGRMSLAFYRRDVVELARALLGKQLVTCLDGQTTSGMIVETEAYLTHGDTACHAARGRTPRNEVMFGRAGVAYVYAIHAKYCFNIVAQKVGQPCAVLIRALRPLGGLTLMQRRRETDRALDLARGPARLCQAMGIDRTLNGADLVDGPHIWVEHQGGMRVASSQVKTTQRIGVTSARQLRLRFALGGCSFVSGPQSMR